MTNEAALRVVEGVLSQGRSVLLESEAKEVCRSYGMRVPLYRVVRSEEEAVAQARELGFPLAAKVVSPDILHKTDVDGVLLNISEPSQVSAAYRRLLETVRQKNCAARIEGVLLERMEAPGIEVIVGSTTDLQFGKVLMFGLGGIFVETYSDVAFRLVPVTKRDAKEMVEELRAYPILKGARGQTGHRTEIIEDLILQVSQMVQDLEHIDQIDLNPVVLHKDQAAVVDAKIMLGGGSRSREPTLPPSSLNRFFKAESVAVVGASTTQGKIGHEILRNLTRSGYAGKVYPVNPTAESILGLKCYSDITSIPTTPDLVVIAVSSKSVPSILEECGQKGVKNVLIISGGFKEVGKDSAKLEEETVSIARKYGMRIIGPNCIGVLDTQSKLDTLFQPYERMIRPPSGDLAFISQSGTVGCTIPEWAAEQGIGMSKFVSYGNRCDVDEGDLIEFLGLDNETRIIAMYVESLGDGRKLFNAVSKIFKKKPVIVLKAAATRLGSNAAKSHTGALAGTHQIALAAFRQAGMIVAHNVGELFDIVKALAKQPLPTSDEIVMVTNGAGPVVMAADKLEQLGLSIARLSQETIKELKMKLPPYCYVTETTVDLTGSATSSDYETALRIVAKDSSVGLLAPFFVFQDPPLDEGIITVVQEIAKLGKPILCCAAGGPFTHKQVSKLESLNIPVYETGERLAVAAYALATRGTIG